MKHCTIDKIFKNEHEKLSQESKQKKKKNIPIFKAFVK